MRTGSSGDDSFIEFNEKRLNGAFRLQRGVSMCGIGKTMAVAECETVAGPTDATITTEVACFLMHCSHNSSKLLGAL